MFNFKSPAGPLPKPQDWQHRPGAPGYFVTKDGQFQMLPTDDNQFAICRTQKTRKGFSIVRGPSPNPEELGIPPLLLEEAEELAVQHIVDQAEGALHASRDQSRILHSERQENLNKPDHFWNDRATTLIVITASKLNLHGEILFQRRELLAAIQRDDLFPDYTAQKQAIIDAEGSWSLSGSFEKMYPFYSPLLRSAIVAEAAQILTDYDPYLSATGDSTNP